LKLYGTVRPNPEVGPELQQRIYESDFHIVAEESMTFRYVALYDSSNVVPIAGERAWHQGDANTTVIVGMNPPQYRVEDLGDTCLASLDKTYNMSLAAGDTLTIKWNLHPWTLLPKK
jgi:hypothetical protein